MIAFICCSATSGLALKVSIDPTSLRVREGLRKRRHPARWRRCDRAHSRWRSARAHGSATTEPQPGPGGVLADQPPQGAPAIAVLEAVGDVPGVGVEPDAAEQPRAAPAVE